MISLLLAAGLFLADGPVQLSAAAPAAEEPAPTGAPQDDYQLVAWCYGALAGYVDLHDEVMPEVTRIESTWRRPGSSLADDLKVYDEQQRQAREDLVRFRAAITAAEKASPQPIGELGFAAMQRGRTIWNVDPDGGKRRLAQEWMSWSLPKRCPTAAAALEQRSLLFGVSLKANAEPEAEPAVPVAADDEQP